MNNLVKNRKESGFTIIEVLIVLAIAGLIMAIVFFAVPQLQRNSRDNQRQSVANRISAELTTYSGNNQGTYPFTGVNATPANCATIGTATTAFTCANWLNRYITGKVNINDPSTGGPVTFMLFFPADTPATGTAVPGWTQGQAYVVVGASCLGEANYVKTGGGTAASSRKFAIFMPLERQDTWYCNDNG